MPKKTALTLGQKKLTALGVQLPLLPTSVSSSLPKHSELIEMRYKVSKGVQPATELERKEKISSEIWIRHQEKLGLDILVDGEMNRGDMISFFTRKIEGFEVGGTIRVYGNRYYKKPILRRKAERREPLILDSWHLAQRMTHKPLKAVLTGPYSLLEWSFNEYYSSREEALADLVPIFRKEISSLTEAGAKIIQIEEPALSTRPEEISLLADTIKEMTRGIKSYFILQHGFGDLTPIWEKVQKLPVDNISIDAANSRHSYKHLLKKWRCDKDLTIGMTNSHDRTIETLADLRFMSRDIFKEISKNRIWLSTESGLKCRTVDESIGKIKAIVETARKERDRG